MKSNEFCAPRTKLINKNYVPENNINVYIDCHSFTVTSEWLNFQYLYLVIFYPFHMTDFK